MNNLALSLYYRILGVLLFVLLFVFVELSSRRGANSTEARAAGFVSASLPAL